MMLQNNLQPIITTNITPKLLHPWGIASARLRLLRALTNAGALHVAVALQHKGAAHCCHHVDGSHHSWTPLPCRWDAGGVVAATVSKATYMGLTRHVAYVSCKK